ncbi:anoctamin-4-like isoform X2 [Dermacentor albipictus]|uniref:anoctamin-4-like isoform X2 n=1 Tax=Dermacentor albipictus TaxID=60249 RepID=UPI0031FBEAB0
MASSASSTLMAFWNWAFDHNGLLDENCTAERRAVHQANSNGEPGAGGTATTATAANAEGAEATEAEVAADGVASVPTRHVGVVAPRRARDEELRSLYFQDGKRRIDFVLAYQKGDDSGAENYRRIFEDNLLKEGLDLELEDAAASRDGKTNFLKIHAPWKVLVKYAEKLHLRMPIKKRGKVVAFPTVTVAKGEKPVLPDLKSPQVGTVSRRPRNTSAWLESESTEIENEGKPNALEAMWAKLWTPFPYNKELIPDETQYFNAEFVRQREHMYLIKNKESFFSQAIRSRIAWEVLMRTTYDDNDRQKGIYRLLNEQVYLAAYPLHDGPCGSGSFDPLTEVPTERRLLYSEWARPASWYKQQPLVLIRRYFGEKTGLYFAWLGFYTSMLFLPAVVGVMTTLYGIFEMATNTPTKETCDPNIAGSFVLCPGCKKRCTYDYLYTKCTFSKIVYMFDNPATVGFSIFMALWATIFIELWKRRQCVLGWEWNLADIDTLTQYTLPYFPRIPGRQSAQDVVNPEYEAKATVYKLNPVTMRYEPYVPFWEKAIRISGANSVVLFMLCLVICTVFGIIAYRIILVALLSRDQNWRALAHVTTAVTASMLNLVIILLMNRVYSRIATRLTDIERPRTQREYEDSFTFKMFLFTFLNTYSSLIYIAFFKGRFSGHPGKEGTLFGYSLDKCEGGCLYEVCVQLAIVMVGKQVINNIQEIGQPLVMNWWRSWRRDHRARDIGDRKSCVARWEADYVLAQWHTLSLFDEYLEMAIQFGFVTLFVAAFPLAPLFALLNNIVEIRLDAYKYTSQMRRPLAERVPNIGAWQVILKGVSVFAVICNAFLIAYTSDFIPRMLYRMVHTKNHSLHGFVNFTLSSFDTSDFDDETRPDNATLDGITVRHCRYLDYREPPGSGNAYQLTLTYWHIFAARLFFVVVFEHVVFCITGLVAALIPDVPRSVQQRIKREQIVAQDTIAGLDCGQQPQPRKGSRSGSSAHTLRRSVAVLWTDAESSPCSSKQPSSWSTTAGVT